MRIHFARTILGVTTMKRWRGVGAALLAGLLIFGWDGANAGAGLQKQKMEAAVDEVFEDLTAPGSPGCALGVYRDGQVIYAKGYGLANVEDSVPITPKSVFDIGSTSK
jgi:CubicO group peptidase (beta-lactamase class C family)